MTDTRLCAQVYKGDRMIEVVLGDGSEEEAVAMFQRCLDVIAGRVRSEFDPELIVIQRPAS